MVEGQELYLIGFAIERFESQRSPVKGHPANLLHELGVCSSESAKYLGWLESSAVSKCLSVEVDPPWLWVSPPPPKQLPPSPSQPLMLQKPGTSTHRNIEIHEKC